MIKNHRIVFIFLFFSIQPFFSQNVKLSDYSKVSIITVGPGKELYERFGHSSIQIQDYALGLNLVYNYGIFDFNAPNFYLNFIKGNLLYRLSRYPFRYFINSNKHNKRWVKKQVLNLTQQEKQRFFNYLEDNAKPKNAIYLYDPFFNNCATKLRDITQKVFNKKIKLSTDFSTQKQSIRQLMNKKLHWNSWGYLGINIALGSKLDKIATADQYLFLPDYIFQAFEKAKIQTNNKFKNLVKKEQTILSFKEIQPTQNIISPLLVFSLCMLIGLYITYNDYKNNKRTKWLDFILFFITGILGCVIIFLWFFTNHSTAPNNYNILWAFAPNLVIAFILLKNKPCKWIKKYILFLLILFLILPIIWIGKIELFPLSLFPIFILLIARYFFIQNKIHINTS